MMSAVTMGFNIVDDKVRLQLSDPADTKVNEALAALRRPSLP
jgi:hypothetical protein